MMVAYLIVGNGVAGNAAAEAIRKIDSQGSIAVFSREGFPFYYRPALPEYLAGERGITKFTLRDEAWYEQRRIGLYLNTEVTGIDPSRKGIVTRDGKAFSYDKLLLATGGNSFVPPIKGADIDGVYTLRTIADADTLKEKARRSRSVVVIGGGLLGLEAGNGLRKLGLKVSIVEHLPRLLPRQMDAPGAALLQRQMEAMGFAFYLGRSTREILKRDEGVCVCLEGGGEVFADTVLLILAGVRPEITLAQSLGLEIDKGIKVDDTMKTGVDEIYAAGDCIEHRGRYYGIWPAAMEQGRVAGTNMAGGEMRYEGTVPSNKLKVAGIDLVAAGDIDAQGVLESIVVKDPATYMYRKLVLKDNVIVGSILLGDIRGAEAIESAIMRKRDISSVKEELADRDFDLARLT